MIVLMAILGAFLSVGIVAAAILVMAILIRTVRILWHSFCVWACKHKSDKVHSWIGRSGI